MFRQTSCPAFQDRTALKQNSASTKQRSNETAPILRMSPHSPSAWNCRAFARKCEPRRFLRRSQLPRRSRMSCPFPIADSNRRANVPGERGDADGSREGKKCRETAFRGDFPRFPPTERRRSVPTHGGDFPREESLGTVWFGGKRVTKPFWGRSFKPKIALRTGP